MQSTYHGVLLPPELETATDAEKAEYAVQVKAGNRAFVAAVFALEDRAAELGVDLDAPRGYGKCR